MEEKIIYRNSKNIPLQYLGRKGRKFTILAPGGLNCWPALYWYVLSVWWARLVIWVIIFDQFRQERTDFLEYQAKKWRVGSTAAKPAGG